MVLSYLGSVQNICDIACNCQYCTFVFNCIVEKEVVVDVEMQCNYLRTLRCNNFMNVVRDLVSEMKLLYMGL